MYISIGKDYIITSDPLNIILNKRYVKKDKDENIVDENALRPIGYYPNLELACKALLNKEINASEVKTLNSLMSLIIRTEELITQAVEEAK
jgi:uncharacterized Rossmann fold enzyme